MTTYCGRFAPTPSGPLHFGSMVTAYAAWLDARHHRGRFLVRMEDVDSPRTVAGAADAILRTLARAGIDWDGPVIWQTTRAGAYREALDRLHGKGLTYACDCSRRQVQQAGRAGLEGPVYPGTCRTRQLTAEKGRAVRFCASTTAQSFIDRLQGPVTQIVQEAVGDFVLRRADGIYSYQLAVVVDDAWQGVTQVVRGADLLLSTPRQLALIDALDYPVPGYLHVPVAVNADGEKLSKQTLAESVADLDPLRLARCVLTFLNQPVARTDSLPELLRAAVGQWDPKKIPAVAALPALAP